MMLRLNIFLVFVVFLSCTKVDSGNNHGKNYGKFENLEEARLFEGPVKELFLTNNSEYEEFPVGIFELTSLKVLSIFGNDCDIVNEARPCKHINHIPKQIVELTELEELSLPTNQIEKIPEYLGELKKLRVLDLTFNRGIDITKINLLNSLEELYLNDCGLESIPNSIVELKNLRRLGLQLNLLSNEEKERIRLMLPNCEIGF